MARGVTKYLCSYEVYLEVFLVASWLVLRLSVPGREPTHLIRHSLVLGISASLAVMFYAGVEQWNFSSLTNFDGFAALGCCLRISFGAILPATILTAISQYLAPMKIRTSAAAIWFAAAILVSIVSQLNCPVDGLSHVVIGHGIMLLMTGLVGWLAFAVLSYVMARVLLYFRSMR